MGKKVSQQPQHGDLRVSWYPQIQCEPFDQPVASLVEAKLLMDTLAYYDLFQFRNRIKPDYTNCGVLCAFESTLHDDIDRDGGAWVEWCDEEGNNIEHYSLEQLRELEAKGQLPKWEAAEVNQQ